MTHDTLTLEGSKMVEFDRAFARGAFLGQRYGQAFYNFFDLHKLTDQTNLDRLYEANSTEAKALIASMFNFN